MLLRLVFWLVLSVAHEGVSWHGLGRLPAGRFGVRLEDRCEGDESASCPDNCFDCVYALLVIEGPRAVPVAEAVLARQTDDGAFRRGTMGEGASPGVKCLPVPNRDTEAMADSAVRLMSDLAMKESIIRGGREIASQLLDYRTNASQVLTLYRRLLDSTGQRGIQGG
jgi:hypothetical protein